MNRFFSEAAKKVMKQAALDTGVAVGGAMMVFGGLHIADKIADKVNPPAPKNPLRDDIDMQIKPKDPSACGR